MSAILRARAELVTGWRLGGWCAAWGGAGLVLFTLGGSWLLVANILLPLLAIPVALMGAVLLDRWSFADPLRKLGKLTLPVFVLHPAFVIFACGAVARMAPEGLGMVASLALPLILTALILAASLLAYAALRRVPGIFGPPSSVRSATLPAQ